MKNLLPLYVFIPLIGFFVSLLFKRTQEKLLTTVALMTVGIHLLLVFAGVLAWLKAGSATQHLPFWLLFAHESFRFSLHFYFDHITAIFAVVGALITLLCLVFSKFYMHRDEGFKRYFNAILLFYTAYSFTVFAGNFETLFIGWEVLGFTSFLLIGFYRDRYLPVKNAMKIISLYRLGDVCLILAMWMAHHLFHTNITFSEMQAVDWLTQFQVTANSDGLLFVMTMLLIAGAVKSAQFPFSSWLPRAMEGPTTSSAIFYGGLSIHLGIFLILRTAPIWQQIPSFTWILVILGLLTSLTASVTTQVQSTIKTQIAYAAIVQIGIMLIEIGLGLHTLALVHFAGHAFLRMYQLLVSPSILGYMIHNQFFEYQVKPRILSTSRWRNTLYMLGIKEWNLDTFLYRYLWQPFKWLGSYLGWMGSLTSHMLIALLIGVGILLELGIWTAPLEITGYLPVFYALLSLMCILHAFVCRASPLHAWWTIVMSQVLIVIAVSLNMHVAAAHVWIYLSTTISAAVIGMFCLHNTHAIDGDISLNRFHGYVQDRPDLAIIFLLSCMALLGFPFTPAFIAIDLMLTQIDTHQNVLLILTGLGFLILEIATLRIYARVYLGQHKKYTHPIAYRSS